MTQIIPAILATTEEEYRQKLEKINSSESLKSDWVQIDLMDNKFVQNKSIGPEIIAKYPTDLKIEAHLMVEYPENWIDELIKLGVNRIVFPLEDIEGTKERINHIKNHQVQVGLQLNPETPIKKLKDFVGTIDLVLVLSVHPGRQGQQFIPEVLEKVKQIKQNWDVEVEVDGGIGPENAKQVVESGADYLVIGSHLLEGDIDENLAKIQQAITS